MTFKFISYQQAKSLCSQLGGIMSLNYIHEALFIIGSSNCEKGPKKPMKLWMPFIQGPTVKNKEGTNA